MKLILLAILITTQTYAYYTGYDYMKESNKRYDKMLDRQEERYQDKKAKEDREEKEKLNEKARIANEKRFQELRRKNSNNQNNKKLNYVKKKYNPKNFKNKPQLKLDDLHILGVKSIKPFKKDTYIIKATSGTFALPKEKLEKAKKINFTKELNEWKK